MTAPPMAELEPQQQVAVSLYLKSMNKSQAARDSGYETTKVFDNPAVKKAIAAQLAVRAKRLLVGGDWVLRELVVVYERCMQTEKTLDRDGNYIGEFRFDASNSLKALALIGKHVDVSAFENKQEQHQKKEVSQQIVERLNRARKRINEMKLVSVDAKELQIEQDEVSFF